MSLGAVYHKLDWRVQISMVIGLTILGCVALVFGNSDIALFAIISFAPIPTAILLSAFTEMRMYFGNIQETKSLTTQISAELNKYNDGKQNGKSLFDK